MSWGLVAVAGATTIGGLLSGRSQQRAADSAANAQTQAAQLGIEEQRRQFNEIRGLLSPYVNAGNLALGGQLDLLGLNGDAAQQAAMDQLQQSPEFTASLKAGEDAILANASATGGLRGGNTQGALAQFRPALLANTLQNRFSRLGGLSALGQNAAAGVGNAGLVTGRGVADLFQQQGAAQAGGFLAGGRADANAINSIFQGGGFGAAAYLNRTPPPPTSLSANGIF